jgi:hypothetical protein
MSFSRHAAANKTAFTMMAILEPFLLVGFFLFIYKWFVPTFKLPILIDVCVAIAASGLIVASWVPDVPGTKRTIHEFTAYGAALMFVPISLMMCLAAGLPTLVKGAWILAFTYNTACAAFFIVSKKAKDYHLYLQAPYFVFSHAAILMTVYIR